MKGTGSVGSRPNVVVVVFDCVRHRGLEPGSELLESMPTLARMASESITFTRAVSPAVWTVPSHASLLSGLYPWTHALHARGRRQLPSDLPLLPALLRPLGYRTILLGANPHLNDRLGLATSFESAMWGAWWEQHIRHVSIGVSPGGRRANVHGTTIDRVLSGAAKARIVRRFARWSQRRAAVYQGLNRLLFGLRGSRSSCPRCVAEWIEPSFERWLASQPSSDPIFGLVNLMEAHEPYIDSERLGYLTSNGPPRRQVRQDFTSWFEGAWEPTTEELRQITRLYHDAVRSLDHRLAGLIRLLREAGRWDETLLIVTSDHGQSFGDHGQMLHGMGVAEDLTRIPLWMRLPNRAFGGERCVAWASLVDILPTAVQLAGGSVPLESDGTLLSSLAGSRRDGAVWTMSDGMFGDWDYERLDEQRVKVLDRIQLASYEADRKLVYDVSGNAVRSYVVGQDGELTSEPDSALADPRVEKFTRQAKAIAASAATDSDGGVRARLESWGYL